MFKNSYRVGLFVILRSKMTYQFQLFLSFSIIFIFSLFCFVTPRSQNFLRRGSSLAVEDDAQYLTSLDKTFTCGFNKLGENAYWFSIWFTNSQDHTVVWIANSERPVNGRGSKVSLGRDGILSLTDVDRTVIWRNNDTSTDADRAELLNSGNLVLTSINGTVLWQSFDFPIDTLLPNQPFVKDTKLISRLGPGTYAPGYFTLLFDNDNVLRLIYNGPDISSVYWPNPGFNVWENGRTNYNSTKLAVLDDMGTFLSSDRLQFNASDMGLGIKRRLTIDYDGNLRLYSLNNDTKSWTVSWQAIVQPCNHGVCGRNGICVYTPEPKCSCPPGYEIAEPGDWTNGCKPKFKRTCSESQNVNFTKVPYVDFWGFDIDYKESISLDECLKLCRDDCLCEAFSYRLGGRCYTKGLLFNGYRSIEFSVDFPGDIYLKLPTDFEVLENSTLEGTDPLCPLGGYKMVIGSASMYKSPGNKLNWAYLYYFLLTFGLIEIFFVVVGWWFLFRKHGTPSLLEDGYHAISSLFRRFGYGELKTATKNFKEELGRGASGIVYKGVLADERIVAVKRLRDFIQGEGAVWAEVNTIGNIYHMNLVRMWGFCFETKHKLVVYEYVENHSLDRHLFSSDFIRWKERFKIAIGMAKGLAYLHNECLEWVIHCDVKPENILLDGEFEPKIADFGLAKLFQRGSKSYEFSRIRGTKGYMAPEWVLDLPITAKVDVYSYGVVILEMVKGTRVSNWVVEGSEEEESKLAKFVRMVKSKPHSGMGSWIESIIDPRLNGSFNEDQAVKLIEIGIACVEEDRNKRPTMDYVVQSLLECDAV